MRAALRYAGLAAWAMVGVPLLLQHPLDGRRLAVWLPCWLFLGAAQLLTAPPLALLAAEALAVAGLVLSLCDGFEGVLLVLVALRLAGRVSRARGVSWIAAQTALVTAAIAVHWSPQPALMLGAPYLGFQLLAFFVADGYETLRRAQATADENARLGERLRISRELHDAVGHHLVALTLNLEAAAALADARARPPLETARAVARSLLAEVRAAVDELRDPEPVDLAEALRALAAGIPRPRVHLDLHQIQLADPQGARTVLRIAQEIVSNAARHAGADNLWIGVAQRGRFLTLSARDDGVGAADPLPGRGLRGIRERLERAGGTVEVRTRPGSGFDVRVELPLQGPFP
jgi:signal transduction histidine kinase